MNEKLEKYLTTVLNENSYADVANNVRLIDKDSHGNIGSEHAGAFGGVKTWKSMAHDAILYNIDTFDKNFVKNVKLKKHERIFRYDTDSSKISGIKPLIKINLKSGKIFFLEQTEEDVPVFEKYGQKPQWINITKVD